MPLLDSTYGLYVGGTNLRLEVRDYMAEVQLVREMGHSDLVPEIVQQMKKRVKELRVK
jgi:hypothetical protein